MAKIRLATTELDRASMPPVCAVCGADATAFVRWKAAWRPGWVGWLWAGVLLGGLAWAVATLVVVAIVSRRKTVELPVCDRHRRRFRVRRVAGVVVVVLLLGLIAGMTVTLVRFFAGSYYAPDLDNLMVAFWGLTAGLFALILLTAILQRGWVKAGKITPNSVLLVGVHEDFADGVLDEREAYFERFDRETPDAVPTRPHPEIRDWDEDL